MANKTDRQYTREDWKQAYRYLRWVRAGKPKHHKKVTTLYGLEDKCTTQTCFLVPDRLIMWAAYCFDQKQWGI